MTYVMFAQEESIFSVIRNAYAGIPLEAGTWRGGDQAPWWKAALPSRRVHIDISLLQQ